MKCWRGPGGIALRRCMLTTSLPTALAALLAIVGARLTAPRLDGGDAPGAATPWLTLPLLVAAVGCCLAAASLWPTFAMGRPGADTIRRLERGPSGGRGAVIAGALIAQLLLSLPVTIGLALLLGAPGMARRHVAAETPANAVLAPSRQAEQLTCRLPVGTVAEELWLRPIAGLPSGPLVATEVAVRAAGEELAAARPRFTESHQLAVVAFDRRPLAQVELTRISGSVPLLFAAGSVIAVGPKELPTWQNGLVAALVAVATSAFTLLIGAVLGLTAGWPTVAAVICCANLVQWIGGLGPIDDALLMLMRGEWLLAAF